MSNASSMSDPKFLQLIVFYYDVAQKVVRELVTFSIQKNKYKDWKDFLGDNIHEIFHLWKNTLCCQCSEEQPPVLLRKPILLQTQINLLLTTRGPEKNYNCPRGQNKNFQKHCSCKISINPTSNIEEFDTPLLVSLLRNCVCTKHDYENCKDSLTALLDVRNLIAHAPDTQLNEENFEKLWRKLTTAVLKIAENTSEQPDDLVELVKSKIKDCQEQRGTSDQIQKGKQYLQVKEEFTAIMRDTVEEVLHRSLSIHEKACSGVQLQGYLDQEIPSVFQKIRKLRSYEPRWFVLRSPSSLECYKEDPGKDDSVPSKTLNVYKCSETKTAKDNSFTLIFGSKKLKLKAENELSRERWIKAIEAIKNRRYSQKQLNLYYKVDESSETDTENDVLTEQANEENNALVLSEEIRNSDSMFELFGDSKKPEQVVAAIDFGTTFSGAAFSTKTRAESNALNVENIKLDKQKSYYKTQTSILLSNEGFVAFGEQAERKFKMAHLKGEADDLYFFRNFKMQLHAEKLSKSMKLHTIDGKYMSCIIVIAACIEHIKEKTEDRIKEVIKDIQETDIHWVLTVPAIWNEQARQFMIKAAEKAGIDRDNLSLALEPECAAVHCKHDELCKSKSSTLCSFTPGSKFMVVDLGGGTVDITVSEVLELGRMKEISTPSGGSWGGYTINKKVLDILKDIFNQEIEKLRTEDINSYLELLAAIESSKRDYDEEDDFVIKLPDSLQNKDRLDELIKKYEKEVMISKNGKHIIFSQKQMTAIFTKCISDITEHVHSLLQGKDSKGVSVIILVGGYASSVIVQDAFKRMIGQSYKLIIPQNPEIVVLTGAVIFGHSIKQITERVSKYNYGIGIRASIDSGDQNLLLANDKRRKIFHLLIEKGRKMEVGKYVESCRIKVDKHDKLPSIELYRTEDNSPEHEINIHNFTQFGAIKFDIPKLRKSTIFSVSLWYDETEFRLIAKDENTGHTFEGIIKYFE